MERNVKGKVLEYRKKLHSIRFRKADQSCSKNELVDIALYHNIAPKIIDKMDKVELINEINDIVFTKNHSMKNWNKGGIWINGNEIN